MPNTSVIFGRRNTFKNNKTGNIKFCKTQTINIILQNLLWFLHLVKRPQKSTSDVLEQRVDLLALKYGYQIKW